MNKEIKKQYLKDADAVPASTKKFKIDSPQKRVADDQLIPGISHRYALFVEEYIKEMNPIAAAQAAGYNENPMRAARSILKNQKVKDRIANLKRMQSERLKLTPDFILSRLVKLTLKAEEDDDRANLLRALEMLGKNLALWTEKTDNTHRWENAFSTGNDAEAIEADTKRLAHIAAPLLQPDKKDK